RAGVAGRPAQVVRRVMLAVAEGIVSPLARWESFYVIVGSSGAALTGLQFVVITLMSEGSRPTGPATIRAFGTPTIVHFCAVLLAVLLAVDAALQPFVKVEAAALALEHVRIIDGTGAPPREDQTLFIAGGKVVAQAPGGAQRIDLTGRTVMPGLVGMHDHLFYPMGGAIFGEMAYSFPRLYLAAGVTTIRTAGSVEPYTDLEIKKAIDAGKAPGPSIWISGPYLEGQGSFAVQMHALRGPDDARKFVSFWADQGATSFKAYNTLTRAE